MDALAPIGVFDSGIGGLTVLRELIRLLPGEDFPEALMGIEFDEPNSEQARYLVMIADQIEELVE